MPTRVRHRIFFAFYPREVIISWVSSYRRSYKYILSLYTPYVFECSGKSLWFCVFIARSHIMMRLIVRNFSLIISSAAVFSRDLCGFSDGIRVSQCSPYSSRDSWQLNVESFSYYLMRIFHRLSFSSIAVSHIISHMEYTPGRLPAPINYLYRQIMGVPIHVIRLLSQTFFVHHNDITERSVVAFSSYI